MEYNKQLSLRPASEMTLTSSGLRICPHCQAQLNEESVPPPRKPKNKRLWIDAVEVLQLTQALALAQKAVEWTERPQRYRPKRGAPQVYSDATVLLTFLI